MIAWLLGLGPALASTFTDVPTVDALVRDSAGVLTGTVSVTHTAPCSLGLCTTYTVAVSETWRGADRSTVTVTLPGGRSGDLTQRVAGLPLWSAGDEVVIFLDDEGMIRWTSLFTVRKVIHQPEAIHPQQLVARELADPLERRHLTSFQELRAQVFEAESTRF